MRSTIFRAFWISVLDFQLVQLAKNARKKHKNERFLNSNIAVRRRIGVGK
jgi:hypothetical protein